MVNGDDIVNQARTWIGTRFHHQGRIKKTATNNGGCDCIGLLIGVARELSIQNEHGYLHDLDRVDYARIPDGNLLFDSFKRYLLQVDTEDMRAGDVLMFKINKEPQHIGILAKYLLSDDYSLIHSYIKARGVVEHLLSDEWKQRIVGVFRIVLIKTSA